MQLENQIKELKGLNDESEYQLEKSKDRVFKLERHLSDTILKLNTQQHNNTVMICNQQSTLNNQVSTTSTNLTEEQVSELQAQLNEQRDLAASRLNEMEKLNHEYQQALKQIEKLKFDVKMIPESVIEQSSEYRLLLTKYSIIVSDNLKIKQAYDETKNLLDMTRAAFQRQIEQMESEELSNQKKLSNDMMQLELQVATMRKDNEILRIEYEQNMAANEQTGPINKEMRSLITTLQTNNKLIKSDNLRVKKRLQELNEEFEKYKIETQKTAKTNETHEQTASSITNDSQSANDDLDFNIDNKFLTINSDDTDTIKELKEKLKSMKSSIEALNKKRQKVKDEVDYSKKVKNLEDTIRDLHKNLNNKKHEESALLNDMEITGQAFEDMQEQNIRLMQQLREKDDANFKLMSERIKLETTQKSLKEEKESLIEQVATFQEQLDAQMNVTKKLEEQVIHFQHSILQLEKEICLLQQTYEQAKRSAIENHQLVIDLKLHTQKYITQLKETQHEIAEKTESLAAQSFNNKRLQEDIKHLKLKVERQKKFEMATNLDEVLKEENREYKEQLRCPSCKVKQKDAVLTKCFHVFCYDCLQKRYESRQRKCPKCNANFGQNDYRKLYLS
jgi:E3 ubiquitin-protein ligase BRE1